METKHFHRVIRFTTKEDTMKTILYFFSFVVLIGLFFCETTGKADKERIKKTETN